jgi:hypothetical protein
MPPASAAKHFGRRRRSHESSRKLGRLRETGVLAERLSLLRIADRLSAEGHMTRRGLGWHD